MKTIKVGYLISYDYEFIKTSLLRVYDFAEEIFFAVDADRKTWSGQSFTIEDDFWDWVKQVDTANKITIYEDHFYVPELTPMECDTRERNMLGKRMGKSDWYIQVDADEYFVDFGAFVNKLQAYNPEKPVTVYCKVATLFKQLSSGYLIINNTVETLSFATNNPVYDLARNNESGNMQVHWDDLVLHQSWARSSSEIQMKLTNWSHKNDFNTESFYNLWNAVDEFNYRCLRDFHPLHAVSWPGLMVARGTIGEILDLAKISGIEDDTVREKKKKSLLSRLWKEIKS